MIVWALLAIHLTGLVGYNLFLRVQMRTSKALHPWVVAAAVNTALAIPALVIALFIHPNLTHFTTVTFSLAIFLALLGVALQYSVAKALQYLEASTYAVIYSTRIIIATTLAALLLAETPTPLHIFGGILILAGVMVLRQKGSQKATKVGIAWGFATATIVSLTSLLEKHLADTVGVFTYAPVVIALATIMSWGIVFVRKYPVPAKQLLSKPMIGTMLTRILSVYGFVLALAAGGLVSTVIYVSSLSVFIVTLLGVILLGERDYLRQKIIATALAVAGLTALIVG